MANPQVAQLNTRHPQVHTSHRPHVVHPVVPKKNTYTYTVQINDSLSSIAAKVYGNPNDWQMIYNENHLTSTTLQVGQKLVIVRPTGG
jgi:LysM repeat protein